MGRILVVVQGTQRDEVVKAKKHTKTFFFDSAIALKYLKKMDASCGIFLCKTCNGTACIEHISILIY